MSSSRHALKKNQVSAGLFGSANVITDAAKNFLTAIIASSDDAIVSKDLNGIVTSWNEGARRIFGYEAAEIIGQPVLLLIPRELHYEEDFILSKIRAGERVEHFETTRIRKNGERFPISITVSPIKDDYGIVIGASKIGRDISDRWRADEGRFRLAALVDSADDAIISKDLNGIITSWNKGAQRLFGYEEDEMIGQSILRLIPEHLRHEEDEFLRKLRAGEKIEHYETTRVSKDGDIREVSITISPIRGSKGEIIGASKIARDISDRKKVERLVLQAEKIATTGRMAASTAHEINNPLASVLNLIFLARQDDVSKQDMQKYLITAESELERVSHIARQTLGFYRDAETLSDVHLQDQVDNVLSIYRSRFLSQGIKVESNFDDQPKIRVHSGEIIQIFSNVVSNAIDAMPRGGRLSISSTVAREHEGGDGLQTVVTDTGKGIPFQNLGQVFEPFFTTKGSLGNGLGLWIARQLVERHGGQIYISSCTEPGNSSTTVSIYLPFNSTETEMTAASSTGTER